jgi:hypothetical protein
MENRKSRNREIYRKEVLFVVTNGSLPKAKSIKYDGNKRAR